jgi:hypoxia up-regulated 1
MKVSVAFIVSFLICVFGVHSALLGVDFGTEYTKAILVAPGVPFDILLTSESKRKGVSGLAIGLEKTGSEGLVATRYYGTHALSSCIKSPQSCLLYPKPLLGLGQAGDELKEYSTKFPGPGVGIQGGRNAATFVVGEKSGSKNETLLVEEVVAMTFSEMKQRALQYWAERSPETVGEIDEVVISVPRHFNEAARIALTDAAELAGMKVIALVDDGLAIALDYAQKKVSDSSTPISADKEYHLIFDSGAGSTKASLVSLSKVNDTVSIEIENYAASNKFNGELFTVIVRAMIIEQFAQHHNIPLEDIVFDAKTMQKAWQAAEKAKLILSANTETNVNIESFYGDIDFKGFVTRAELEVLMEAPTNVIKTILDQALYGFNVKSLKSVILAGGSVRVPLVQHMLSEYFGTDEIISKNVNADESVVFGTTLRGAQMLRLTRKKEQFTIIDHTAHHYDIHYSSSDLGKRAVINVPNGLDFTTKNTVNLTDFSDRFLPEIQAEILQDSKLLTEKFNFTMPKRFNETTCLGGKIDYVMTYGFNKLNFFNVNGVKVYCYPSINGTISETPKIGHMHSSSEYYGFQPMPESMKATSRHRLRAFDNMDEERAMLADAKNTLEAKLYEIRYLIEEYEQQLDEPSFDRYNSIVTEELEWLDYESDGAKLSEIEAKIVKVTAFEKEIQRFDLVSDYDAAMKNIVMPYESLVQREADAISVIEKMKENERLVSTQQCESVGLDYEKLIGKLYSSKYPERELAFTFVDQNLEKLSDTVESIQAGPSQYESLDRLKLIESIELLEKTEDELTRVIKGYTTVAETRTHFITQQVAAAKKKEKKRAEKKSKISAATEIESQTSEITSSESTATSTAVHDEL